MEENKEHLRFPPVDYDKGTLGRVLNFKEKELIKYFDLDKRFLATQANDKLLKNILSKFFVNHKVFYVFQTL